MIFLPRTVANRSGAPRLNAVAPVRNALHELRSPTLEPWRTGFHHQRRLPAQRPRSFGQDSTTRNFAVGTPAATPPGASTAPCRTQCGSPRRRSRCKARRAFRAAPAPCRPHRKCRCNAEAPPRPVSGGKIPVRRFRIGSTTVLAERPQRLRHARAGIRRSFPFGTAGPAETSPQFLIVEPFFRQD